MDPVTHLLIQVKYSKNNWKCQITRTEFQKTLGDSVFSFSHLDSVWPNYKNSPIFIQEKNKKFKFVLQCYLLNTEKQGCDWFLITDLNFFKYWDNVVPNDRMTVTSELGMM